MKKTTALLLTAIITTSSYVAFANEGILNPTETSGDEASPTAIITVEDYTDGDIDGHIVLTEDALAEIAEELTVIETQLDEVEESVAAVKEELEVLENSNETENDEMYDSIKYDKLTKKLSQLEALIAKMQVVYAKVPAEAKPAIEAKIKKTELRISSIKQMLNIVAVAKSETEETKEVTSEDIEINKEPLKKSIKNVKKELKELKNDLKEYKKDIKSLDKELEEYKNIKDSEKSIKEDKEKNYSKELTKATEAKVKALENKGNEEGKGNKKGIKGDK